MKSKFFGTILGLALSIQGVEGMQNPDMEAWLEAEFDKCSQGADVRVRQVFDKGLAIDVGNKQYIIDAKGNIYHRVWGTDSLDDSLCKVAVRMKKDAYEEWTGRTDPDCSDIKCNYSAAGALLSVNIQDKINFLYNFISGELVLNSTDYDKKLVIEANRICTAKTVNVKDLILKSYEDWFLNFGQLNHQRLRLFSHFGVNFGSYNSGNTTEWESVQLNLLLKKSEKIYNKYAGMNGYYSAPESACDVQNITTRGIMEVQFGGTTRIGGTLDTDAQVILGYRAGTPDPDNLIYQCNINEIKNAPSIFVDTSSEITNINNGGIRWDKGKVKKITPKTEETVKKLKDAYYVTNPPDAVKNVNKNDFAEPNKWYLVGDEDFSRFVNIYLMLSMLNTASKKLSETEDQVLSGVIGIAFLGAFKDTLLFDNFEKWYDVQLHNNGQSTNLKLRVKGTSEGPMITFYSSDGREYKRDEEANLATALNNSCLNSYFKNENYLKEQLMRIINVAIDEFFNDSEGNQPMVPYEGHDDSEDNAGDENAPSKATMSPYVNLNKVNMSTRALEVIGAPSFECEQVEDDRRYPEFALHFFISDINKMAEQQSESQDASLIPNGSDLYPKDKCSIF